MALKSKGKEWPYWCAAFAAVLLFLGTFRCFYHREPSRFPKGLVLGDSIYAESRGGGSVSDRVSSALGKEIFNGALGGTSLARADEKRLPDERMDAYSMASLSKSLVSGDFGVQKQIKVEIPATEYYDEVLQGLTEIDFEGLEILFLGYGMNDYQNGTPLENPEDPFDEYTFGGALRSVLRALRKTWPELRIVLLTPTYSWYVDRGESCESLDFGGGTLREYVELEKKIGEEYGAEVIDLYGDLYPHETFEDWKEYTRDGVHPNEAGIERIAEKIASRLEEHQR